MKKATVYFKKQHNWQDYRIGVGWLVLVASFMIFYVGIWPAIMHIYISPLGQYHNMFDIFTAVAYGYFVGIKKRFQTSTKKLLLYSFGIAVAASFLDIYLIH